MNNSRIVGIGVSIFVALGLGQAVPTTVGAGADMKVFVCKFAGTPGVDERLQTGDNPISVSVNSIRADGTVEVGDEFADAQGRSVVLAFDNGQPEPDVSECDQFLPTTTTSSSPTTTTGGGTTTTTGGGETTTTTGGGGTTPTTVRLPDTGPSDTAPVTAAIAALTTAAGAALLLVRRRSA